MEMEYHQKTGDGDAYFLFPEFSIGSFFPITHPRFPFQHLCVATLKTFMRGLPQRVTYV